MTMPIDYSKYPPDWKEIRQRILDRDGNCCQKCGLRNRQTVYSVPFNIRKIVNGNSRYVKQKIWFRSEQDAKRASQVDTGKVSPVKVVLTIAHLDHDEENWDVSDDRLAALCQMCHLRYDAKEKDRRIRQKARDFYNNDI